MRPAIIGVVYGHRLDTGGVETHLASLIRRCDPARFRWRVISAASAAFAERALALGAQVLPWAPTSALDGVALVRLVRLLRAHPVDLLHLHSLRATLFGRVVAHWLGLPAVVTVHMPSFHPVGARGLGTSLRHRLYGGIERRLLQGFPERIIHVSARAREETLDRGAAADDRTVVIENGVDLESYAAPGPRSAVREELAIPEEATVVVCVARLDEQKGLDTLLEALGLLRAEGARPHAWLIGDGPRRCRLEQHARRLGLLERVRFLGFRTDVPRLLHGGDVFVLPSRYETTPFALLEAMAAGLPSVATDVGESRRLLGHDEGGRVVPAGDPGALAAALQQLVDDGELRARLSAGARRRVRWYSDVRMAELTATVYEGILRSRRFREVDGGDAVGQGSGVGRDS